MSNIPIPVRWRSQLFTSSGSYTPKTGAVLVCMAGGGGGGGGCGGDNGDGACTQGTLTVNPDGITVTVTVDIATGDNSSPPPDDATRRAVAGRLAN